MSERAKTVRVEKKVFRAILKYQEISFPKASIEAIANAAMIIGLDSLQANTPNRQQHQTYAQKPVRNTGD